MAVLAGNRLALFTTDYVMGASGSITPPSAWTVALATLTVSGGSYNHSAVWSASVAANNLNELGSSAANGYSRQTINKDQTAAGWGAGTTDTTGATTTGKQVTFGTFTSTGPNPNGANSWVVTDGTTLNAGNFYFMGDTAATRTFNSGDTEKVTPSLKAA